MMDKLQTVLEKSLFPIAEKLGTNSFIKAISAAMISSVSITIVGSIFSIIANLPFQPYLDWLTTTGLKTIFTLPISVTTDMYAIIVVILIGYNYAKQNGGEGIFGSLISLASFMIVTPLTIVSGETTISAIPFDYMGVKGMFVAIVVGLIASWLYCTFIKKEWYIKMPQGVPPAIEKSFATIVPSIAIITLFMIVRWLFTFTPFGNIHQCLFTVLQTPMMMVGTSPLAVILLVGLNSLFFFFGIHPLAINSLFIPMFTALDLANLEAYNAGLAMPNLAGGCLFNYSCKLGGQGMTLALVIYMAFFAKSKQYKTLGKLSLPASIFNVNEPIIFGMPIMLNPIMLIPFVITPVVTYSLAYLLTFVGILSPLNGVQLPAQTPAIISGFLTGGVPFVIYQIFALILSLFIYLPFFKMMDKKAVLEEN